MVRLKEFRRDAAKRLESKGNKSPMADVDYLLICLGYKKSELIVGEKVIESETLERLWRQVERVEEGEPVQYVAGVCEFMSLEFGVTKDTLIPRADTEVLVEAVIDRFKDKKDIKIFEIGSGSGCIAVSLGVYLSEAMVISVDFSKGAVDAAKENARRNGVHDRVDFRLHNIFDGNFSAETFDVVVSNPPYIPTRDINGLETKVRDFEPLSALDGGEDGLDFYKHIIERVRTKQGCMLAFEVGINQAQDVAGLMADKYKEIEIIKDLSGIDRVVLGYKR